MTDAPAQSDTEPSFAELLSLHPHLTLGAEGLAFESVPLARIADAVGTPVWVYSATTLLDRLRLFTDALRQAGLNASVHFAMKANANRAVLATLGAAGAGMDIVSEGELRAARAAGIPADRIVFAGVGKREPEIRHALGEGIFQFNAESPAEIDMIAAIATAMGRRAPVALRVNPDVDAGTHEKISTGRAGDKFGIAAEDIPALYARMAALPGIAPAGLAVHIGSQISGLPGYRAAYGRLAELARALEAKSLPVPRLDCGGGLGIPYRGGLVPGPADYAAVVRETLGGLQKPLLFEPGRWLAGPAGVLLASVVLEKKSHSHRFVILDAAMNDLVRPSMYGAWHGIVPVAASHHGAPLSPADIVGPVCESGDRFATGRMLPALHPGDRVAFLDAGAYGSVMSSCYNGRPLAAEVMVKGSEWAVVRERQGYEALWADERLPGWLAGWLAG
jgi:diaminopimelate decarboxylase